MDREQAQEEIMNIRSNSILCELPTSHSHKCKNYHVFGEEQKNRQEESTEGNS